MTYKEKALALQDYARKIFLLFETAIKLDEDNVSSCIVTVAQKMDEEERDRIFHEPIDWTWKKDAEFVCVNLCHKVWGRSSNHYDIGWCPCHRFGQRIALKKLKMLCKAIRETESTFWKNR